MLRSRSGKKNWEIFVGFYILSFAKGFDFFIKYCEVCGELDLIEVVKCLDLD